MVCGLKTQILIFLREATQGEHIRLLYEFEMCTTFFGCVGSCGYVPPSVKLDYRHSSISAVPISAIFDLPRFIILSYFPPL